MLLGPAADTLRSRTGGERDGGFLGTHRRLGTRPPYSPLRSSHQPRRTTEDTQLRGSEKPAGGLTVGMRALDQVCLAPVPTLPPSHWPSEHTRNRLFSVTSQHGSHALFHPVRTGAGPSASSQVPGSANRVQEELAFEGASPPCPPPCPHLHPGSLGSSLLHKSKRHCLSIHHPPPRNAQTPAPACSPEPQSVGQGHGMLRTEGTLQSRPPGP